MFLTFIKSGKICQNFFLIFISKFRPIPQSVFYRDKRQNLAIYLRAKTTQKKTGIYLCDLELGNSFLEMNILSAKKTYKWQIDI